MSRQQLRKHRLLELEKEQHLEDAEGLVITEEQRQLLLSSFMSVKFEFHDLDGLRWTQTALRRLQHHGRPSILRPSTSGRTFIVLPNIRSMVHDLEATIRGYVDCLPSDSHQSPKRKKHGKSRPSITSQSLWGGDTEIDTLTSSFPLPPSTLPPSTRWKASYTLADNPGLMRPIADETQIRVASTRAVSLFATPNPSEDGDFFYDTVMYTTSPMGPTGVPLPLQRPRWAPGMA